MSDEPNNDSSTSSEHLDSSTPSTPDTSFLPEYDYKNLVKSDGSFEENWHVNLTGDYEPAAKTAAQFKSLPEMAKAVYESRKALSQRDDSVRLPGPMASDEEVARYRDALGIPKEAKDYVLARPESIAEDAWDANLAADWAAVFHEVGVSPKQAEAIVAKQLQIEEARNTAWRAEEEGREAANIRQLQAIFGQETTAMMDLAKRTALGGGATADDIATNPAFNDPKVIEILAFYGRHAREDMLPSGESVTNTGGAAALAKRIATDPSHPEYAKYHAWDQEVREKVARLHAVAAQEEERLGLAARR